MTLLGLDDTHWSFIAPVITYWVLSGLFEFLSQFDICPQHRVGPSPQEMSRNLAKKRDVVRHVLIYQAVQTAILFVAAEFVSPTRLEEGEFGSQTFFYKAVLNYARGKYVSRTAGFDNPRLFLLASYLLRAGYLVIRQLFALIVLDTWVFWAHYTLHQNRFLYRYVHSVHHQLYTPYSYGALYNHWFESLASDGLGGVLGVYFAGLTDREAMFFYSAVTGKTVEDHNGLELPFSPFVMFSKLTGGAGIVYHHIHHQSWGLKTNFAIYFPFWDWLMGTDYQGGRKLRDKYQPKIEVGEVPIDTAVVLQASGIKVR